jgi:hypothetical protein
MTLRTYPLNLYDIAANMSEQDLTSYIIHMVDNSKDISLITNGLNMEHVPCPDVYHQAKIVANQIKQRTDAYTDDINKSNVISQLFNITEVLLSKEDLIDYLIKTFRNVNELKDVIKQLHLTVINSSNIHTLADYIADQLKKRTTNVFRDFKSSENFDSLPDDPSDYENKPVIKLTHQEIADKLKIPVTWLHQLEDKWFTYSLDIGDKSLEIKRGKHSLIYTVDYSTRDDNGNRVFIHAIKSDSSTNIIEKDEMINYANFIVDIVNILR